MRPSSASATIFLSVFLAALPTHGQIAPNVKGDFQSELRFSAGEGPVAVAIGDVNGDGKPDLVVADYNGFTVSVLLGNGDGTFGSPTTYTVVDYPYSVALADLNGDGHLDIVCTNLNLDHLTQGGAVSVLLGNGDGTFKPAVNYVAGNNLAGLALADFNGDGKIDIAVADVSSSSVAILLNNGDGTFQAPVKYPAGSNPFSLAAADFSGDGKIDLAVTNVCDVSQQNFNCPSQQTTVTVLLGKGDGTFGSPVSYQTSGTPYNVIVQDVNSDGKADLVISNSSFGSGSFVPNLTVLLGNGDGTFQSPTAYSAGGFTLGAGDFDGDSVNDLVMGSANGLIELLGAPSGGFYAPIRYSVQLGFSGLGNVAVGDLNGDGRPDVVAPDGNVVGVFLNAGGTNRQATNVTLTSSQNPALITMQPTLTASVTPTGSSPQGSVTFYIDGQAVSVTPVSGQVPTGELNASDQATCCGSPTSLGLGTHTIVAIYSGDTNTQGSTSAVFTQTINPLATSTSVSSSANPSETGQAVTFTATITSSAEPGIYQGSVTFLDGSSVLGTVSVTENENLTTTASLSESNLSAGTHSITASYSGGGNYGASTSAALQQVVNGTLNLVLANGSQSSAAVSAGGTAHYSLMIGGSGFGGQTTLTCLGAPTGAACSVTPSSLMVNATAATALNASVTTTSRNAAQFRWTPLLTLWLWAVTSLWIYVSWRREAGKRLRARLVPISLLFLSLLLASCGGGSGGAGADPHGTPTGNYQISVQAASGAVTASISLTLTVE